MNNKDKEFVIQLLNNAINILKENNNIFRNLIVKKAKSYIGKCPYILGGKDIKKGIDCSGFTQFIYLDSGISGIPRDWVNSKNQRLWGKEVNGIENARPGDLICYEGHVAIYVGNNQIIDAGNSRVGISQRNVNIMPIITIRNVIGD